MTEWALANPWLTTIIAITVVIVAENFLTTILFRLPNRVLRHWSIRKHRWPAPPCDADGDIVQPEE